jgi:hypothetical protein
MIMKLKAEARAQGGCRASEKKNIFCAHVEVKGHVGFQVLTVETMKCSIFWI